MKLEGYPRRIDTIARTKTARRFDGMCPRCPKDQPREKSPGRSYCLPCDRAYDLKRTGRKPRVGKNEMTPRRLQVLQLRCEGLCDKKIGVKLGLRTGTVKHIGSWLRKQAQAKTQAQLGVWAVRNGHVPMEAPARIAAPVSNVLARPSAP